MTLRLLLAQELSGDMKLFVTVVGGSVLALLCLLALVQIIRQFMFISRPNELLVFSGRKRTLPNGDLVGYRVVSAAWGKGRSFRWPILEQVKRMDLSTMEVEVHCRNAFCKGGIRLHVQAVANVKISPNPAIVHNAIERFLDQDRREIQEVAKNTLEGHLRAVVATLTPEEVNEDRLKFSERLKHEAELDLNKLGLHLDTFNIHSVSDIDGSSYLAEIGRKSIAEVLKNAEISEAMCERAATEAESKAKARAGIAREQAETAIKIAENDLAEKRAQFEAKAKSVEEEAQAARQTARARAELELQQVRSELEARRLQAEVVVAAEAEAQAKAFEARAEAAPIAERGKAMAGSLELVRQAWKDAGDGAKPIFVIQQLDGILREVVKRVQGIRVDTVSLVDRGDGSSLPSYVASYPATVNAILKELDGITGIDIVGAVGAETNGHAVAGKGGA
ncbi:MAG: flotillin family protein [Planctomycetota bacterium]|nr:MAG: flotillin family protein [Planctomycetota bacterium]